MRLTPRAGWLALSAIVAVAACVGLALRRHPPVAADRETARVQLPRPVRVEVRNTTTAPGMARAATEILRHAGLDVVQFGSADSAQRGRLHNEVLVRRGDTTGVGVAVGALGGATVIVVPDSSLLVDLTILIGADYRHGPTSARP